MEKSCRCEAIAQAERMLSQPYMKNGVWHVDPLVPKADIDFAREGSLEKVIRERRDAVAILALELMGWPLEAAYDYVDTGLERFGAHPEAGVDYVITCAIEDQRLWGKRIATMQAVRAEAIARKWISAARRP